MMARLIIQEIMGTDYRVELITSMNNGPSFARCDGLKNLVRGGVTDCSISIPELPEITIRQNQLEYTLTVDSPTELTHITFVDSDDYIEESFYDRIIDEICFDSVEILEFGWVEENIQGNVIAKSNICRQVLFENDIMTSFMCQREGANYLWNKIFSIRVFNGTVWSKLYAGEDYLVLMQVLKRTASYRRIEKRGYHYIRTESSLTARRVNVHSNDNIYSLLIAEEIADNELKEYVLYKICAVSALMYCSYMELSEQKMALFYRDMFYTKYRQIRYKKLKPMGSIKRFLLVRLFGVSPSFCRRLIKLVG